MRDRWTKITIGKDIGQQNNVDGRTDTSMMPTDIWIFRYHGSRPDIPQKVVQFSPLVQNSPAALVLPAVPCFFASRKKTTSRPLILMAFLCSGHGPESVLFSARIMAEGLHRDCMKIEAQQIRGHV